MFKTLLAGTLLSTGLLTGGIAGEVPDKKEETSIKDKVQYAIQDKDKDGNITYKEIDESELPKDVQLIRSTEDLINKGFKEKNSKLN